MQQNIKYTGLASTPSDYECPDGQLAVALGLVGDDGSLKAIPQPQVVGNSLGSRRILFLHATASYRHYIVASADASRLYWIAEEHLVDDYTPQQAEQHLVEITHTIGTVLTVNAVGNTLAVMTDTGLHYVLWKNRAYKPLGQKPPELQMQFTTTNTFPIVGDDYYADYAQWVSEVWALINRLNKRVTDANRFYAPFKVRYCYRLFDGSMVMHSAPVFMPIAMPYTYQVEFLKAYVSTDGQSRPLTQMQEMRAGESWINISTTYMFRYQPNNVGLQYRVLDNISTQLNDWADIVKSVDIFVTPPILREITDSTLGYDYRIEEPVNHYIGTLAQKYRRLRVSGVSDAHPNRFVVLDIPRITPEEYREKICDTSTFYKIASLDLSKGVLNYSTSWELVPIKTGALSALAQQEIMVDDYRTHNKLVPAYNGLGVSHASLFSYNNRLNISGVNDLLFQGFDIRTLMPADYNHTQELIKVLQALVYLQTADGEKVVSKVMPTDTMIWHTYLNQLQLFYPDRRAKKMLLKIGTATPGLNNPDISDYIWFRLDMEECPTLNGAVTKGDIFEGLSPNDGNNNMVDVPLSEYPPDPLPAGSDIVNTVNKVYTSEVDNPYHFPALNTNSVGTGEILALCTTTKALSQGQFGQFPLYAFTTDGVWALSVAPDGTYSSMHAVSRDVCTNPHSITQIDSAVIFVTDRGIMLLQGSDTRCISDGILADNPFDPSALPHLSSLRSCPAAAMSHGFLASCRMVYDYRNQHIVVFNPAAGDDSQPLYPYAFVYNLKSHLWGMMHSTLLYPVNSYPEALAIDRDGHLVSFDAVDETSSVDGLLVTRPLKLGNANGLKTIHTLLQRGVFARDDVKTVLYGSRDLIHWHLVASSVDHSLRSLRGTPYKYFRIAAIVSLDPGESLSGATIDFEPRHTTKLH